MVGLPCAGKSTRARQLVEETGAVRLSTDAWKLKLFPAEGAESPNHDPRHAIIEELLWTDVGRNLLIKGVDIILDFGCWSREERLAFKQHADELGADFCIHYMHAADDELMARLRVRNTGTDPESFYIPEDMMRQFLTWFEPLQEDEMQWVVNTD